jgi:hypothetical protein
MGSNPLAQWLNHTNELDGNVLIAVQHSGKGIILVVPANAAVIEAATDSP